VLRLATTSVFESYWRFAAERLAVYYRRLRGSPRPWTDDPVIRQYRFTNAYRAADRVTQYLIREVQYRDDRSQAPDEVFFRTLLFKIFNRIDTWEMLERELGTVSWQSAQLDAISSVLDRQIASGRRVYSAAYIMPSPKFGHARKHQNHLALLASMMRDSLPAKVATAATLRSVYELLLSYPGVGAFLAFQYAIDLNYSTLIDFDEADFVVAGPGALDGIAKCFGSTATANPASIIHWMTERQDQEFAKRGLEFEGLFGRPLQPIDCQNIFCEISKYARAAHPDVQGASGRSRIKQRYEPERARPTAPPFFPPKWNLHPVLDLSLGRRAPEQLSMI
jgi:alpha-glutamyl/putrescinyl thymine pyrophosphorylase clade 1